MQHLNEGKKQAEQRFVETGRINSSTFTQLLSADPTNNKKYIEKMCDFFLQMKDHENYSQIMELERIMALSHLIEEFHEKTNRNIISGNDKDIQRYSEIDDFEKVIIDARGKISNTQKKKKEISENSVMVYDDDAWRCHLVFNWTGAKKIGSGTKWCITFLTPVHWNDYFWRQGQHFYVITNKAFDSQPVSSEDKNPLYKVAAQVNYSGQLSNFWDAPDSSFNPILDTGMNEERRIWWNALPDKIKKLLEKPEPEGESRKILVHNHSPKLGHNVEKNVEQIHFKDFYVNSDIPYIDFSRMKNIDFKITGAIVISDTDLESLESVDFSEFKGVESFKIEGNKKLKSLKGLPKNISGTLTIENNPSLGKDAIDDLKEVTLRKKLTWKNNKEKTSMYDFLQRRWAPVLGSINAK